MQRKLLTISEEIFLKILKQNYGSFIRMGRLNVISGKMSIFSILNELEYHDNKNLK